MSFRNRIKLNRRRFDIRNYLNLRNFLLVACGITVIFFVSSLVTANILKEKVKNSTVKFKENSTFNIADIEGLETEETTPVINENTSDEEVAQNNQDENNQTENKKSETTENAKETGNNQDEVTNKLIDETNNITPVQNDGSITMNFLGELMFGGEVTSNLNYLYTSSIKEVYNISRNADFTYANFSTNITSLEEINNAKSKYLVTKDIINALNALGLDSVSIASDHMVDFPNDIVNNTISTLEESDIFVAGREDMPVYFEKGNKKIAVVSTNAVLIGTAKNYSNVGISTYTEANFKKNIKEAKESADFVIADVHWGRDHTYGLTDQMRNIAKVAIDSGADMVLGTHALGVYPIVVYNGKPIIYSTGTFITDSDYTVAKEGFIFKLKVSNEGKIDSLELTPTYIEDKKIVRLYSNYNPESCAEYLNQFNNWHIENGLNSSIEDDKIIIKF